MEGFWTVQFEGIEGGGCGVAVLLRGRVYGGDSGVHYLGNYAVAGNSFTGDVLYHEFMAGIGNVLGVAGDYRLRLRGEITSGSIEGTAELVDTPGAGLAFKLKKVSDLAK